MAISREGAKTNLPLDPTNRPRSIMLKARNSGLFLSQTNVSSFMDAVHSVLITCEGVLWLGEKCLPGARQIINTFNEMGKAVIYTTNDDSLSRENIIDKLEQCGLNGIHEKNVIPLAFATSFYLKERLKCSCVVCFGPDALLNDITEQKITVYQWKKVQAIVLGLYLEFSSGIAYEISLCLRKNRDVKFIVTSTQSSILAKNGHSLPGVGAMIAMIKEMGGPMPDHVIGKPEEPFLRIMMTLRIVVPEKTLLIGERMESDIFFANRCGFRSLLVLTGSETRDEVVLKEFSPKESERMSAPEYIVDSVMSLYQLLSETGTNEDGERAMVDTFRSNF